jgi:triple functional domain protein
MDSTGSVAAVEAALDRLNKQREELEELWATRKLKLDLCLRLRLFERDALEVSSQLELWSEELQHTELSRDTQKAEQLLRLHSESVSHMQNTTFQVLQQGQELAQVSYHKLIVTNYTHWLLLNTRIKLFYLEMLTVHRI